MPLDGIKKVYTKLGYSLNGAAPTYIDIDGIQCETASTTLVDSYEFRTQWGCIGQGDTLVSPMQLMMWQSAVANGNGKMTMPHLINSVTNVNGKVVQKSKTKYSDQLFSDTTATATKQILLTNGANHYSSLISGYTIGVKSGTAQVDDNDTENSLLVGFVDDVNFPIAFCIMIENKAASPVTTDQIVKTMLDALNHQ